MDIALGREAVPNSRACPFRCNRGATPGVCDVDYWGRGSQTDRQHQLLRTTAQIFTCGGARFKSSCLR